MEQRKYISILGDDRSTFEGVTPKIGSFYSPSYVSYAGFATPEGTWWMQLIHRLAAQYPAAQIWVGTITVGKPSQGPWYLDPATLEDRAAYNDVLRQCVAEAGPSVHLADLTPIDGGYETVNGTHPNRAGMVTFADDWYQAMAGTVPTKG